MKDEIKNYGYLSAESKRKFTLLAGILGAVFFLLQIFIPFVIMGIMFIFNFLVGIMMIALTENWQRIGDLAARTIVIEKDSLPRTTMPEESTF